MVENRHRNIELIYNQITNILVHHESLLFQRLNYFLVAIAFITAAFSTLLVNYLNHIGNPALFIISLIVAFAGFFVSWSFIIINYHNSLIIREINLYVERVEKEIQDGTFLSESLPHSFLINSILRNREPNPGCLGSLTIPFRGLTPIWDLIIWDLIARIFKKNRKSRNIDMPAPTTWLIPFGFAVIWIAVIGLFIPTESLIIFFVSIIRFNFKLVPFNEKAPKSKLT
jgi:hypothetical protein